jgi:hypothetical protein
MTDEELLTSIRSIVREEIQMALKVNPGGSTHPQELHKPGFDLRGIAQFMGLDIFPRDFHEIINAYKVSGNMPTSMKESWQRFKDWKGTPHGSYAASFSHRAYLDSLADRRNKLKAEGKWPASKKKSASK